MKFLEKFSKNPKKYQRLIGINDKGLKLLIDRIEPLWDALEEQRLTRANRKRKIGGGHPYTLSTMYEKLVTVLFYYKQYVTQEVLGSLVDVDQSVISRLIRRMLPLLEEAADPELKTYLAAAKINIKEKQVRSKEQLVALHPDLADVSTDATQQQCYRPKDNEVQKQHYSGKTKLHTLKTQISVASTGRILDVSKSYPGSVHDKRIIDQEKTVEKFDKKVPQRHDSGYQGIQKNHPEHYLITPIKKPKKEQLSPLAKEMNQMNSKRRIVAEHAIGRVKRFKICSNRFRQPRHLHNQIFRNVAALVNFSLKNNPLAAQI